MSGTETQSWDRIARYSQCQGRAVRAAALSQKWRRNVVQALQLPSDLLCRPHSRSQRHGLLHAQVPKQ